MLQRLVMEHGGDRFVFAGHPVPRVWIRQTVSATNGADRAKREATLAGLRLGKINRLSILPNIPETWGMIRSIEHLVTVVACDHGPLPLWDAGRVRSGEPRRKSRAERLRLRRAKSARRTARNKALSLSIWLKHPRQPSTPRNAGAGRDLGVPIDRPEPATVEQLETARRRLAERDDGSEAGAAIRNAGGTLRAAGRIGGGAPGDATAQRRLLRRDLEHDLLNLLLSENREIAWEAACEIASSFGEEGDRIRLTRGLGGEGHDDRNVVEAVVEVLRAEGQRYFSLMRYQRSPIEAGGIVVEGNFVVSKALEFGGDRKAVLQDADPSDAGRVMQLLVYADGGIKADDVTPDDDVTDDNVMLANRFSLRVAGERLSDPFNLSFVVPGVLVDTVEIATHA